VAQALHLSNSFTDDLVLSYYLLDRLIVLCIFKLTIIHTYIMPLTKEIYRDEYSQYRIETFYNDKQQIIGTLFVNKWDGKDLSQLGVYEYTGENYRLIKYKNGTKAYAYFTSQGPAVLGKTGWYSIEEAFSVQDFKYEEGVLVAESYRDEDKATYSHSYTYENGMKVSETSVSLDGTVTNSNFTYQGKTMLSKATFINNQFSDQINYSYHHQLNLLSEEQKFLKHNESLYLSSEIKFFYNEKKELEKTEYYGRYDSKLHLYKIEETIRKGNERNMQHFFVPDVEMAMGYYDLASMHDQLKRDNLEWLVSIFDAQYMTTAKLQRVSLRIDSVDNQGNIVEMKMMNPETGEEMAKLLYRNEYNDKSLLEFVICYRVTEDGKTEESSITKFYY